MQRGQITLSGDGSSLPDALLHQAALLSLAATKGHDSLNLRQHAQSSGDFTAASS